MIMQNKSESNICYESKCEYNFSGIKPHIHFYTPNGTYVKFIIYRSKPIKEMNDADTW